MSDIQVWKTKNGKQYWYNDFGKKRSNTFVHQTDIHLSTWQNWLEKLTPLHLVSVLQRQQLERRTLQCQHLMNLY